MSGLSGLRGPSFLPDLKGPGRMQICNDQVQDEELGRRIIVTFGSQHAIRYDLEDNSVVAGYYCPTFLRLSTPLAYDSSVPSYVCGVNDGKELLVWDGIETKLENILNKQKNGKAANKKEENKIVEIVLAFPSKQYAIGLTFLTDVKGDRQGPECYVVFKNGNVQTVKYLLDSSATWEDGTDKDRPEEMGDVPSNSIRLDTSIFLLDDKSNSIRIAHAYMLGTKAYVSINRAILDAETGKIRQSIQSTVDLKIYNDMEKEQNNNTSAFPPFALSGKILTYITLNGDLVYLDILNETSKKVLSCLSKSESNILGLDPINLTPDKGQYVGVQLLNERRIAIVGPRKDGEGHAITIVDAVFDVLLAGTKIKTTYADKDTEQSEHNNLSYLMLCHAKQRILFKHGSKVANVILDDQLPYRLSGFIGHETNLDVLPSDMKTIEPTNLKSTVEEDNEIPKWEIVHSGTKNENIGEASQALDLYRRLPVILANRDVSELENILDVYTDIPELLLLNILECLINEVYVIPEEYVPSSNPTSPTYEERAPLGVDRVFRYVPSSCSNSPSLTFSPPSSTLEKIAQPGVDRAMILTGADKIFLLENCLVKALNVSITEKLMTQRLRQCNFEIVTHLLHWILFQMKNGRRTEGEINMDHGLVWIGMILNSHYTNLILSGKSNERVKNLILSAQALTEETKATMDVLYSTLPLTKMICDASKAKSSSNEASSAALVGLMQSASIGENPSNMANRPYSIEIVEF